MGGFAQEVPPQVDSKRQLRRNNPELPIPEVSPCASRRMPWADFIVGGMPAGQAGGGATEEGRCYTDWPQTCGNDGGDATVLQDIKQNNAGRPFDRRPFAGICSRPRLRRQGDESGGGGRQSRSPTIGLLWSRSKAAPSPFSYGQPGVAGLRRQSPLSTNKGNPGELRLGAIRRWCRRL